MYAHNLIIMCFQIYKIIGTNQSLILTAEIIIHVYICLHYNYLGINVNLSNPINPCLVIIIWHAMHRKPWGELIGYTIMSVVSWYQESNCTVPLHINREASFSFWNWFIAILIYFAHSHHGPSYTLPFKNLFY